MENKKQSSVEWFDRWFRDNPEATHEEGNAALQQAKAMHKEEYRLIYEGLLQNVGTSVKQNDLPTFEQYYNEIFGGQDERDRSIPQ